MTARILVVDDVLPNVKLLAAKLTQEYFDVLTATSGTEALKLVGREMPDIVLLDVMMPGMDGFEVCRRIKANPATAHIPVVMVTALDQASDKVAGLEAGADDFLTKPVDDLALYARVRSLARLKVMMDELRNRELTGTLLGVTKRAAVERDDVANASILLIHQKDAEAQAMTRTLSEFGKVTLDAGDGDCADIVRQRPYDLLIVRLTLGDNDGLRVASKLRSYRETRQVPILVIAEEGDTESAVKALDFGVNDYLMRPIDENELRARTRTQIRRKRYADRLRESFHLSIKLATSDAVTGVYNRHYLTSHLATMLHKAMEHQKPFALLMLDIDHFKQINDHYGHVAGDEILRQFAERISLGVRGVDMVARYGGEEFVVLMPETTQDTALRIAERLRTAIADTPFTCTEEECDVALTTSIGIAAYQPGDTSGDAILERADDALYAAKRQGRNRIESNCPLPPAAVAS
ncbi:MAG: PleD family two-component system response regulator [Alphaproteobacteria bacterium]|nr:MAG: PleD family two-component system response regulator [Alphaproteobacteria bacterium]